MSITTRADSRVIITIHLNQRFGNFSLDAASTDVSCALSSLAAVAMRDGASFNIVSERGRGLSRDLDGLPKRFWRSHHEVQLVDDY